MVGMWWRVGLVGRLTHLIERSETGEGTCWNCDGFADVVPLFSMEITRDVRKWCSWVDLGNLPEGKGMMGDRE